MNEPKPIEPLIQTLRGQRVILDADLAKLYGVQTKVLNQAVKRNAERFPEDFTFRLTEQEKTEVVTNCDHLQKLKFSPQLPAAYTEHGAIMAAMVVNSPKATIMSVLNRAFGSILHGKIIYRFAFRWCGHLCRCANGWQPTQKSSSDWRRSIKPCWNTIRR